MLTARMQCQASATKNVVAQQRLAAADASKAKPGSSSSGPGSSLLAEKMANMAAARAAAGAAASAASSGFGLNMQERRAVWAKTGVVALRDMQLSEIQPQWLEGARCDKQLCCCMLHASSAMPPAEPTHV
jgi:hypothetical protein